jgi:hypothetical protein
MMTQQVKDSQRMLGNNFEKLGKYVPCVTSLSFLYIWQFVKISWIDIK